MKKTLIVTDFQNDYYSGPMKCEKAEDVQEAVCRKIEQYRKAKQDIIFILDTHDSDYPKTPEGRINPVDHCYSDSEGWRLAGKVGEMLTTFDTVFIKPSYGSFELGRHLREEMYDEAEICGLMSETDVFSNAVIARAAIPEAKILVDTKACAAKDEALAEKAFELLKKLAIEITD